MKAIGDEKFHRPAPVSSWLRSPDLCAPLVLAVIGILFFSDFLFSSKNFYFRDILNFHYPLRKVLIDSYARWEFPLWNPHIYLGQPLLANPNYLAFYPTILLHLFCSFNYAFKLHFIIHPIAGGLGMYFLQRRLGLAPLPSFGGSAIYQFSGIVLSFLNLFNILPAVALIPWIGWAFLRGLSVTGPTGPLLLGVFLALQAFAFEPMMFQCLLAFVSGLALYTILESSDRRRACRSVLRTGLIGGLVGAGLAAVQILPSLELMPLSARGPGFDFAESSTWSMHPIHFLNTVVPNLFGNFFTIGYALSWGEPYNHGREGYLVSFFVGTGTLLLALLGFFSLKRRLAWLMAGLLGLSVALALGSCNPLYRWIFEQTALLRVGRYPSKYILLAALATSVLASLGLQFLLDARAREERRGIRMRIGIVAGVGFAAAAACLMVWHFWQIHPEQPRSVIEARINPAHAGLKDFGAITSQLSDSVRTSGLFLLVYSGILTAVAFRRTARIAPAVIVVLALSELVPANLRLSPLISDADMSFVSEVNGFIRSHSPLEPVRVLSPSALRDLPDVRLTIPNRSAAWFTLFHRMTGQPLYGIAEGIQYSVDLTVDHLNTYESEQLARICARSSEAGRLNLMRRLNTPFILSVGPVNDATLAPITSFPTWSDKRVHVSWLQNTARRAYFASSVQVVASHADALKAFLRPDFNYISSVVLEQADKPMPSAPGNPGKVRIAAYESRKIVCEVEAEADGYLVLLDSHYPGWRAYVDGRQAEIVRANYAFRAVSVAAGRHRVEFHYEPTWFYAGLTLSCIFVAATLLIAGNRFRRKVTTGSGRPARPV